jgi:hypothetical protein
MNTKKDLFLNYSDYFNKKSREYLKNKSVNDKNLPISAGAFTTGSNKDRYTTKKATVEKYIYVRKSN